MTFLFRGLFPTGIEEEDAGGVEEPLYHGPCKVVVTRGPFRTEV